MTKWHAHVAHMDKHMSIVGAPWDPPKSGAGLQCVRLDGE